MRLISKEVAVEQNPGDLETQLSILHVNYFICMNVLNFGMKETLGGPHSNPSMRDKRF